MSITKPAPAKEKEYEYNFQFSDDDGGSVTLTSEYEAANLARVLSKSGVGYRFFRNEKKSQHPAQSSKTNEELKK